MSRTQIASLAKSAGVAERMQHCAATPRKAMNGEKPYGILPSTSDDEQWQKFGDLALVIGPDTVQLDSWVTGIRPEHDVVIAAWLRGSAAAHAAKTHQITEADPLKANKLAALAPYTQDGNKKARWADESSDAEGSPQRPTDKTAPPAEDAAATGWQDNRSCDDGLAENDCHARRARSPSRWLPPKAPHSEGEFEVQLVDEDVEPKVESKSIPVADRYRLLGWIARATRQKPALSLTERMTLKEGPSSTDELLCMSLEPKTLLDNFLNQFFWECPQGFCRKLQPGCGVKAMALRSSIDAVAKMKDILDIRRACIHSLYPTRSADEVQRSELDPDEVTLCYHYMFDKWCQFEAGWRADQRHLYTNPASKWKPFRAYLQRVYGGKHLVLAFFQVGLAWLPRHTHDEPDAAELGVTPRHALSRFLDLLKRILTAKNAHEEDLDTHRAKRDSGDNPRHTFRGTCRGCLREAKQKVIELDS